MLTGISSFCFLASYGVALALEIVRLFVRWASVRTVMLTLAIAGLFAHSVYLWLRIFDKSAALPGSWHLWWLVVAWVLALIYLGVAMFRPQAAPGLFMLPLVIVLGIVADFYSDLPGFPREQAQTFWSIVHGMALLLGTIIVMLGFVAGVMYLVQSYRLKHKLPPGEGLRLPSLEWLQKENERALVISSVLLGIGLASGIVLNLIKSNVVAWTEPVVWTSGVLFVWLIAALTFNCVYKPARRGRKVAYLVLASFLFLVLDLGIVLWTNHASSTAAKPTATTNPTDGAER